MVNDAFTLVATRVVDLMTLGTEEEDEGETVDRAHWERKASAASLNLVDEVVREIQTIEPTVSLKFNKYYLGLASDGVAQNFVTFRPKKQHTIAAFKIPWEEGLSDHLETAGLDVRDYDSRHGNFRVWLRQGDVEMHREDLRSLITQARDAFAER